MKLEHSFDVEAPLERVWARLIDVEKVAPCLPGAEISESSDGGVYEGASRSSSGRRPPPTPASSSWRTSTTSITG